MSILDIDKNINSDVDIFIDLLYKESTFEFALDLIKNKYINIKSDIYKLYDPNKYYIIIYKSPSHISIYGENNIEIGYLIPINTSYYNINIYPHRDIFEDIKIKWRHIYGIYEISESLYKKLKNIIN